jgi:micrococcal nuclease
VYLEDGTFVNASMVRNGYATVMTTPPNVKYADTFAELARKARKRNRGLWNQEMNYPDKIQGVPD